MSTIKNIVLNNFLFPFTLLMFSVTYMGARDLINSEDLIGLVLYFFVICSIQYYLINVFFKSNGALKNIIFAIVMFANTQIVVLDFILEFSALKAKAELSAILLMIVLFYFLSTIFHKLSNSKIIPIMTTLILTFIFLSLISYNAPGDYKDHRGDLYKKVENVKIFDEYYKEASKEKIIFEDKPDIVFLAFESLVSEEWYREQTKRFRQTPIHKLLQENMMSYKNHFSDELSSRLSIASTLAMTPSFYHNLEFYKNKHIELSPRFGMLSGHTPSPFLETLKLNGYEITTFAEYIGLFGAHQGPYVDYYHTPPFTHGYYSKVCTMFGVRTGHNIFFGYCFIRESLSSLLNLTNNPSYEGEYNPDYVWSTDYETKDMNDYRVWSIKKSHSLLSSLIDKSNQPNAKPQFLMGHINFPRHMDKSQTPPFKNKSDGSFRWFVLYYENRALTAALLVEKIFELFKDRKRNTIIYIFGDHGISLTYHLKWEEDSFEDQRFSWTRDGNFILGDELFDLNKVDGTDPEGTSSRFDEKTLNESITYTRKTEPYMTADRYGSYGGLYSSHRCAVESKENNKERKYQTPQLVIHDLISCLADNESKKTSEYIKNFKRESTLRSQSWHENPDIETHEDFVKFKPRAYRDHLYEK